MDTAIKILPFLVGIALGVVGVSIILKFSSSISIGAYQHVLLIIPAAMVLLTGIYIFYRSIKDLKIGKN